MGFYVAYAVAVGPLIESPVIQEDTKRKSFAGTSKGVLKNNDLAERYLSSVSWVADAEQTFTKNSIIFYRETEIVETEKAVRMDPFAMIWMTHKPGEREQQPITVIAESATVVSRMSSASWMPIRAGS